MESYFLAGRSAKWWVVGCSLFSYGTGVEFIIGMTVSGFTVGISAGFFLWGSIPPLFALSYYFLKEYRERDIITLPTFLFKPYRGWTRLIYAIFVLVLSVQRISLAVHYGGRLLGHLLGYPQLATTTFMVVMAVGVVLAGGLRAIINIEVLQTCLLIPFSLVLMFEVYKKISLQEILDGNPSNHTHMIHDADDNVDPWPGLVFGYPVEAMVYWCCSQVITQKALTARNDFDAKVGCIFCGLLNMLTPFLFVLPGMAARVLFFDELVDTPQHTYEVIVKEFMPHSCQGFLLAALVCSVITSVASVLSASSAIITLDVFERSSVTRFNEEFILTFDKNVVIEKTSVVCVALTGFGASFLVQYFSTDRWNFRMGGNAYSAVVLAAFLCAAFFVWKVKPSVISVTLIVGFTVGALRSSLEVVNEDDLPDSVRWFATSSLYVYTAISFVVYMLAIVIVSKILMRHDDDDGYHRATQDTEPPDSFSQTENFTEVCSIVSHKTKSSRYYDDETVITALGSDAHVTSHVGAKHKRFVDCLAVMNFVLFLSIIIVWIIV